MAETAQAKRALMDLHPWHHRVLVPIMIVGSSALLARGLSLPLLYTKQMFWNSSYSVWAGVVELWKQNELTLSTVLFFFSIVFPITKLIGLTLIWFIRLREEQRDRLLYWLGILGKWSMLDVFVVAILIVLVKLGPLARVEPRVGVYVFAAAIVSSMLTTMYVEQLARH